MLIISYHWLEAGRFSIVGDCLLVVCLLLKLYRNNIILISRSCCILEGILLYMHLLCTGAFVKGTSFFGRGHISMPIGMDDVSCSGSERSLTDCPHTSNHNCGHYEDAGVVCNARKFIHMLIG